MRSLTISHKSLVAALLLLAVATACSSSSAIPPAFNGGPPSAGTSPSGHSATVMQPGDPNAGPLKKKKPKPLLYVAIQYLNEIYVYEQTKKKPVVKYVITDGLDAPQGIATDKSGNLYVANQHSVTIYKPGAASPSTTITEGLDYATDVAVDGGGNIYVTNIGTESSGPWVEYYPSGSTSPTHTWYLSSSAAVPTGIALIYPNRTSMSEFYVSFFTASGSQPVGDVDFCDNYYTTCFDEDFTFGRSGGIALESSGYSKSFDYITVDQNVPGFENISASGITQVKTNGLADYVTFNSDGAELYVSDQKTQTVDEYAYPAMSLITTYKIPGSEGSYQFNLPTGVAVSPSGSYL